MGMLDDILGIAASGYKGMQSLPSGMGVAPANLAAAGALAGAIPADIAYNMTQLPGAANNLARQSYGEIYQTPVTREDNPSAGHISPESAGTAAQIAATALSPGAFVPKPAGAVGVFGGRGASIGGREFVEDFAPTSLAGPQLADAAPGIRFAGDAPTFRANSNWKPEQRYIDDLPPPSSDVAKAIDRTKGMSRDEVLSSDPLWGYTAKRVEAGEPAHEAFADLANQLFAAHGLNSYITPEIAKRFMAEERAKYGLSPFGSTDLSASAPGALSAPATAQPAPEQQGASGPKLIPVDHDPFAAAPPSGAGGSRLVPVDHDPFAETPGVRFAPQGQVGANGLIWDKDGGRDPKTGELVIAGKPMTDNAPASQTLAASTGFLNGVPILGPYLEEGTKRAATAMQDGPADQARTVIDNRVAASQAAYPKTTTAAGIGGAVVGMAPAIAAAPEVFGAGGGPLTAGQVVAGGLSGAAIGGGDAAVRHGLDPATIAVGAGGGALGGAVGPIIGAAGSRVANAASDFAARASALRGVGISRPAAEIITRAAEADGALGGAGAARIADAGPQGMLADAGPGVATVLDTAMQRGGPGTVAARQAIEERAAGADQDLTVHLDGALGAPQGLQTAETAIRDGSAAARQAAYDAAYATPINYTTEAGRNLETMVANRVPPGVIARANMQMRMDGTPTRQMIQRPDGTLEQMPDVRQIDYITRSLNDVARAGDGQGALGGNTSEGRSYGNLARELRNTLRQAVPEYGQALDTAAQPIQARNALEFGSDILRPAVPRDVVADQIAQMTGPELAQARQGLRSTIAEQIANVQRTITDPNVDARQAMSVVKQLSSDAAREKMALLIGDQEAGSAARGLDQALTRATRALELRASVAGNSRTFARTATNDAVKEASQPGILAQLLGGDPVNAGRAAAKFVTSQTPADLANRQNAIYGELANVLTGPRGPAATDLLSRLTQANNTRAAARSIANSVPYGALSQTGILALLPSLNSRPQ